MMKRNMFFCAVIAAGILASAGARAQTLTVAPADGERRVSFDSVPNAVQNALTNYSAGVSSGAAATVWRRDAGDGLLYRGRITDVDGSSRVIDVTPGGRVQALHQFAPPLMKAFDPGVAVAWHNLPGSVQRTIQSNTNGLPVTTIVRKAAANGMTIYVAATTDATGAPVYIETTMNGNLVGVKRKSD